MTRPTVVVRDARAEDVPAIMELWRELRDVGGRLERAVPPATLDGALDRLRMLEQDRDSRALVAVVDAEVAGFAVLTRGPYAALFDQTAVHVHYLHVRQAMRRHGVGKALLAASASFADECGADHVMTSVLPQLRDTNRFYARLGFAPVVVRRSVPVSVLRRRLAAEGMPAASAAEHVVARRRTMRRVRAAVARMSD